MTYRKIAQQITFSFLLLCTCSISLMAQEELTQSNLRFYLSKDKSSYAGFTMINQIWTRLIQNNPNNNEFTEPSDFDIGIRRSRLIFYTHLKDRVFVYTQVGSDGLTFSQTDKQQISLINAQTELTLKKDVMYLGFGLHTWNGISRYNNSSATGLLVVDNPGFTYPIAGIWDRFGRQLGIYAKGTVGRLHYRMSLAKPFRTGVDSLSKPITTERLNDKWASKGYFSWQFLDKENYATHSMSMNNLGRAKIFNLGAGFYYHPKAMISAINDDNMNISNIFLFSTDIFVDLPINSGGALTSYLGYYNYDFGKDYLRSAGRMNVSTAKKELAIPQGIGNNEWEVGTGSMVRAELGYLLPSKIINSQIQPFGAVSYKNFEALDEASAQFDIGVNILQMGHNIKWTCQASSRPIYNLNEGRNVITDTKWQFILQTQICF